MDETPRSVPGDIEKMKKYLDMDIGEDGYLVRAVCKECGSVAYEKPKDPSENEAEAKRLVFHMGLHGHVMRYIK